jgi:predicted nucleotidyltransferase
MGLYPLFPGLDLALEQLVDGIESALGDALVGAYLHGSIALGDGDEWSDVDFLVLTAHDLGDDEEQRVQELHAALFAGGPLPWARRLDGSYAALSRFRALDPERRSFLYLDNGSFRLVWDPHCNTALIRHLVREHGVVLSGPDPKELIEPIAGEVLRAEAHSILREYAAWAKSEGGAFRRWDQAYLVLTLCRVLYTAETGGVAGKRQAVAWATDELDPVWRPLLERAIAARDDPNLKGRFPAERAAMEETLRFVEYARGRLAES